MTAQQEDSAVSFPENEDGLNALMAEAARLQRSVDQNEKRKKDRLAEVNARFDELNKPLLAQLDRLTLVIMAYIKANRKKLTDNGKRQSFETADTIVKFRNDGTGTLEVTDENGAVAALEKRKDGKIFVVVKKTLDKTKLKQWLLANSRRRVPGVAVVFKPSLSIQLKQTAAEKRRKVKPTVVVREIDD